jgi:hypothetical protein
MKINGVVTLKPAGQAEIGTADQRAKVKIDTK